MKQLLRVLAADIRPLALFTAAVIVAYAVAIPAPLLLDEQFLSLWAKEVHTMSGLFEYVGWHGPSTGDMWGPLSMLFYKLSQLCFFQLAPLYRVQGLLIHLLSVFVFYKVMCKLWTDSYLNQVAALLFAVYPFNAEAVSWLGGRPLEISVLMFIAAVFCYLRARTGPINIIEPGRLSWRWLALCLCCWTAALLSCAQLWISALFFVALEIYICLPGGEGESQPGRRAESPSFPSSAQLTVCAIGPLTILVLTSCYMAASGLFMQAYLLTPLPRINARLVVKSLYLSFFPVNKVIWKGYEKQLLILWCCYAPAAVALSVALFRRRHLIRLMGLACLWFLLTWLPTLGHLSFTNRLYGMHLLYASAMPLAILIAGAVAGCTYLFAAWRWKRAMRVVSILLLAVLSICFISHTGNENAVYNTGGRLLKRIQKCILQAQQRLPVGPQPRLLLVSNLPDHVSVCPIWAAPNLALFAGDQALLSSNVVSAGHLKDLLCSRQLEGSCFTWNSRAMQLFPWAPLPDTYDRERLDGECLLRILAPPLPYNPALSYDAALKQICVASQGPNGPVFTINTEGMKAQGGDFIALEAQIDGDATTPSGHNQAVENTVDMYWQTGCAPSYDRGRRRVQAAAYAGDGQVHRYLFSLRSIAMLADGAPTFLTFGFPAGTRARICGLAILPKDHLFPSLEIPPQDARPNLIQPPFVRFPDDSKLGLGVAPARAQSLFLHYSVEAVPGASGVIVEISQPNQYFAGPNGDAFSQAAKSRVLVSGTNGTCSLSLSGFQSTGIVAVRAVAVDGRHQPIGNFSDSVYCLLQRRPASGWVVNNEQNYN